jgi:hypothetical protein
MKLVSRIATLAVALSAATPAFAQDKAPFLGLGVGFSTGNLTPGTIVFVPLNIAPTLRIEPFLSIDRADIDANTIGIPSGKESDIAIGAGAFYLAKVVPQVQMYVGGRLGFNFHSFEQNDATPDEETRRDFILAAALGGEYLPHPRIAVGAEAMLGYVAIGDTEFTPFGQPTVKGGGGSSLSTQGTIFVRAFIF